MNTAANKHKQEGELVVPVVAPALLVRVRHGAGLETLETCNMQTLGGRFFFSSDLNILKLAAARHSNLYALANIFWPFFLGPTLTSRSDDRAINHASARDGTGTLCEHRMCCSMQSHKYTRGKWKTFQSFTGQPQRHSTRQNKGNQNTVS